MYIELLQRILIGHYDNGSQANDELSEKLNQVLRNVVDESEILAMDLMILSIRETAEEEAEYAAEVKMVNQPEPGFLRILDKSRYLRETYEKKTAATFPPGGEVPPDVDKRRREAVFKALCVHRFVRQGIPDIDV